MKIILQALPIARFGASDALLSIVTALASCGLIGAFFFMWLNTKFSNMISQIADNRDRLKRLESDNNRFINKDDHSVIRREDKEGLERQINEVKQDIKNMPDKIVNMLRPFLNK